jgi:hypothetical protein
MPFTRLISYLIIGQASAERSCPDLDQALLIVPQGPPPGSIRCRAVAVVKFEISVWSCGKPAARQRRPVMTAAGVTPPPDEDSDNLRLRPGTGPPCLGRALPHDGSSVRQIGAAARQG